jgi:hypothetical protein
MKRHLETCVEFKKSAKREARTEAEVQRDIRFTQRYTMSPQSLLDHVLRIIIAGDLSFRFASNIPFVEFVKICYPNLQPPSRFAIANRLTTSAQEMKYTLAAYFMGLNAKVSIALDSWNSRNNKDYLGIAHCPLPTA